MRRIPFPSILSIILLGAWIPGAARTTRAAQNSEPAQGAASGQSLLPAGTIIDTSLSGSLDAKKSKPGDRVEAHTVQDVKQAGKLILKKGTRLTGHVTEAEAHTKDQPQSVLGILFDRAVMKNGQEIPVSLIIEALAPPQVSPAEVATSDDGFGSGGGFAGVSAETAGVPGGGSATLGPPSEPGVPASGTTSARPVDVAAHSAGAVGGLMPSGRLAPNSSGVFGLEGLSLRNVVGSGATDGSVVISTTKNVHLDSGTQMLLSVTGAR